MNIIKAHINKRSDGVMGFADAVGASRNAVYEWMNALKWPKPKNREKIEKIIGKELTTKNFKTDFLPEDTQ